MGATLRYAKVVDRDTFLRSGERPAEAGLGGQAAW